MIRLFAVAGACVLGAFVATPAVVIAAEICQVLGVHGLPGMVIVQLVRDLCVLLAVVGVGAFFAPALLMQTMAFSALCTVVLVAGEPLLSARTDTVAAAWHMPRLIGRLSAALFAFTMAAGADAFFPRRLRVAAMWVTATLASPLLLFAKRRWAWRAFARMLGARAVVDEGIRVEPQTLFERAALLGAWPGAFPAAPWAKVLGDGAACAPHRDRDGRWIYTSSE